MTKLTIVSTDLKEPPKAGGTARAAKEKPAAADADRLAVPADMKARHAKLWREVVEASPHLEESDRFMLRAFVDAWTQYEDKRAICEETGPMLKSPNNFPVYNPFYSQMHTDLQAARQIAGELGLTFMSRKRAKIKYAKAKTHPAFANLKDSSALE